MKKKLLGFLYSKNMANFEAFCQVISSCINKGGGTSEALKLKLHLNSEVYKGEIFMILLRRRGKFFELHLKKTRSAAPGDLFKWMSARYQLQYFSKQQVIRLVHIHTKSDREKIVLDIFQLSFMFIHQFQILSKELENIL